MKLEINFLTMKLETFYVYILGYIASPVGKSSSTNGTDI